MTITPRRLAHWAGAAAILAGAVFIGVQLAHPRLDAASVTSTDWLVRSCLKVAMACLALVGTTGLYLHGLRRTGRLAVVGFALFASGYLLILGTSFVAAFVLPSVVATSPAYVEHVLAAAGGGHADADIGALGNVLLLEGALYLAGGLLFGVALYRARVGPRWAAALLAVGGLASAAQSLLPDPWFRMLAFPNGVALIALGYWLWRATRAGTTGDTDPDGSERLPAPGATRAGAR